MKASSFPHALIILVACIVLAGGLTYLLPAGHYARQTDKTTGPETVIAGSYQVIKSHPVGFAEMMLDVPKGLVAAGEIIALIPVMVFTASRLGYSRIDAVAISTGCAVIGSSFSPINPFQVGIAQKIAEVPLFSGSLFRIAFLLPAVGFWIFWVIHKTKHVTVAQEAAAPSFSLPPRHRVILLLVAFAFALMVYGILRMDWDFNEMSAEFFVLGLVCGFIGKLGLNGTAGTFAAGVKEMALAAFIVGLARAVYLVLQDGLVIDSISLPRSTTSPCS
jgi:uncharacterized ion transporter superfamily protein YfcC